MIAHYVESANSWLFAFARIENIKINASIAIRAAFKISLLFPTIAPIRKT